MDRISAVVIHHLVHLVNPVYILCNVYNFESSNLRRICTDALCDVHHL